ncbi:MAG: ABC transporter substrate-binding protein [Acidobacteria bacterium]|nr:ABC transporter substrate-binding protein [Acidobacteriota bacterium]
MPMQKIRIMVYRHSVFYSPLIATIAAGFLKDEGLEAEYFPKPRERNLYEMFRKGEVDIMQAAVSTSWDPLSKLPRGVRDIPVHFAQINQRDGFFLVGRPSEQSFEWKQLEGSRLLADHAQQPLAMLKYGLHLKDVDWSRVEAINAGTPEAMADAFRSGQGGYVHLQGPLPQQLEAEGAGRIVAAMGEVIPPVAFSSLMASREFLETAQARSFMKAYRRALAYVIESPAPVVAESEASFFPGLLSNVLAAAISRYQKLGCWRHDPTITREQYETAMDVFIYSGVFKERYPYEDVVTKTTP